MSGLNFDQSFVNRIKNVIFEYEDKIPESMHYYYKDILDGNNLEMYMSTYSLSKEDLLKYARVCRIIAISKEMSGLMEILTSELDSLENEEIQEYSEVIGELQDEGEEFLKDISSTEEEENKDINFQGENLIVYSTSIDDSYERTIGAHSGKEEQTQRAVANLIEQLSKAPYLNLRTKGYIHQNQEMGNNKSCYVDGNAYERLGRGSTKVNYIRVPISENNKTELKQTFKIDFDTMYLVLYYGDFKNEGMDELKFYNEIYLDLKKHYSEVLNIINIFKNDFTNETRSIAYNFVNNGFKLTDELTSIIKVQQSSK